MKLILMCAVTLDGKIAKTPGEFIDWTGSEDKKFFAKETKKAGVVIMGNGTFKTIGHPLRSRLNIVFTKHHVRGAGREGGLEYASDPPRRVLANLASRGFKTAFVIGGGQVNSLFLKHNLVDEIWLTIVPKVFGRGVDLFSDFDGNANLEFISCTPLPAGLLFVKYKVRAEKKRNWVE